MEEETVVDLGVDLEVVLEAAMVEGSVGDLVEVGEAVMEEVGDSVEAEVLERSVVAKEVEEVKELLEEEKAEEKVAERALAGTRARRARRRGRWT